MHAAGRQLLFFMTDKQQNRVTCLDQVMMRHYVFLDWHTVDECSVGTAQIVNAEDVSLSCDTAMPSRKQLVGDADRIGRLAANRDVGCGNWKDRAFQRARD